MPSIEILDTGWIDKRDSAFPQAVQLPNGDILCSFNVGGGPNVHGGTDWARSTDGGATWTLEGTILPPTTDPDTTSALKLSRSPMAKQFSPTGHVAIANLMKNSVRDGMNRCSADPLTAVIHGYAPKWCLCRLTVLWRFPMGYYHSLLDASWHRRRPFRLKSVWASRCYWQSPTMVDRLGIDTLWRSKTPTGNMATLNRSLRRFRRTLLWVSAGL